jgi:site-specific DNA-methyltransferase (adenine-specific)/modification methylase
MSACEPLDDPAYPPHPPAPWRRREVIGLATLYLGDCREIAPGLERPAAVISDPPYGIGAAKAGAHSRTRDRDVWPDATWDDAPADPSWVLDWNVPTVLWGGNYFNVPPARGWLVWDKLNPPGFSLADCELAWSNRDGAVRRWHGRSPLQSVEKHHPTEKPAPLMSWCIERAKVPPGGAILDPYMGSGSTGVAAVQMRHPVIGIEIEPRYFDIACRRIDQAQRQGDLLRDSP